MPYCPDCRKHYREKWNRKGCRYCGPDALVGEYPPAEHHLPDEDTLEKLSRVPKGIVK